MKHKSEFKDMWVFIQHDGTNVEPVSLELCCETRKLCDAAKEELVAVIVGKLPESEIEKVAECGVDKIIFVDGTGYDYLNCDAYANLFTVLCRKYEPTAVMVGGTIFGRDFAPRFACRLPTGCTSDATELVWDPKTTDIEFVEPAVGGKMMAVITVPVMRPQVGTIRPGTFKYAPTGKKQYSVVHETVDFPVEKIQEILDNCGIVPAVMQVEAHPYYPAEKVKPFCDEKGIKLQAWYPLGHGNADLINDPVFAQLAEKYGKSAVQVILRWHIQMGFALVPGSKSPAHIKENAKIFDFELTHEEMSLIAALNRHEPFYKVTPESLHRMATTKCNFEE